MQRRRFAVPRVVAVLVAALVLALAFIPPARAAGSRFFDSLRLAKPQPVAAAIATPAVAGRRIDDAVAGMVAAAPSVTLDEPARDAPNIDSAAKALGFRPPLIGARHDAPSFLVIGAREIDAKVDRGQLGTILDEAGEGRTNVPATVQDASLHIRTPRALQVQYGHCPVATANTIQGQLQGPPPPSTDYGDCVVLTEGPPASLTAPPGIDVAQLVRIALELQGMSPNQTQAVQRRFPPQAALALGIPRFMRSYDSLAVNGNPAMLMNTAGRRGPTYAVAWTDGRLVYELSGYGNAADAAGLAGSIR